MSNESEVIGWLWRRIDPSEGPGMWHHSVNAELMSLLRDRDDHDVRDLAFADHARQLSEQRAELLEALRWAEAALAEIGDACREDGDEDLSWCERRAAKDLSAIRATIANATQQRNATGGEG